MKQPQPLSDTDTNALKPCEAWKELSFSQREKVRLAIVDPASVLPRIVTADKLLEDHSHWQMRAVVAAIEATRPEAQPINSEELAILHGQQVTVTFKNSADAFALFNELKARTALEAIPSVDAGESERAYAHAVRLAEALQQKHYADASGSGWKPLPDLFGVIDQIDNMTTGLERSDALQSRISMLEEAAFKDGFVLGFDHRGRTDDPLEAVKGAERDWNHRATLATLNKGASHEALASIDEVKP